MLRHFRPLSRRVLKRIQKGPKILEIECRILNHKQEGGKWRPFHESNIRGKENNTGGGHGPRKEGRAWRRERTGNLGKGNAAVEGNLHLPGTPLDKENVKINDCNVLLKILQKEQDKSKEGGREK